MAHLHRLATLLLLSGLCSLVFAAGRITHKPASRFHFIDIDTPAAGPCDLCTGPDGAEWVQYLFAEKLGRIDPQTGHITEYSIPFTGPKAANISLPGVEDKALVACVIRPGKDGNIYAANGLRNQLVKLDMKTKKVSVFTPPNGLSKLGNLQPFNDMWGGDDGMFYSQSTANLISLFNYETEKFKSWKIPTPASAPLGMRTTQDGDLWFTELVGQKIARLNPSTGHIKEYPLPVPALLGPAVMRVETQNKYLWFTGALSDSIGRLDIETGELKAYRNTAPASPASVPSEITEDGQGNIWWCTWTQNLIHKLNPKTGRQVHIAVPDSRVKDPVSLPFAFGIGIDYFNVGGANRMYFTQATSNRVGYYQL